jgi:glycosyltransferase involved in cell wall biosynthesis
MFDIVMPLFNKEAYVGEAIKSVLAQTYRHWNLIIVDDGSADGSVAAAGQFQDERIHIVRQENSGPGRARNAGIDARQSPWIAFLDADDVWLPSHLATLNDLRVEFPHAALVGSGFIYWSGGPRAASGPDRTGARRLIRYFREVAEGTACFYTSSLAVSRRAIEQVGMFKDAKVGEDTELWARLALHGLVAVSTRRTSLYRVDTGGLTDQHMSDSRAAGPLPSSLAQVSLALRTLVPRLEDVTDPELRNDILDYIDYEVGLALLRALRLGRIDLARRLVTMFQSGPRGRARIAAWLAGLPAPLGQRIMGLGLFSKRAARAIVRPISGR